MSLSVVKRPQGYVIDTTEVSAVVSSSSGALFTKTSHGLSTGNFIYISSNLSAYNGYWYVSVVSADTFRVREYATASDQAFINSGTVTYFVSQLTHNWNCVHLPIIYKLKSDVWPTNGADTARTITSFSNYNEYTYVNASGDIKATGTASALEQVILSGTSVDGVYQILNWFSDTNFVINLPYSAGNTLTGGTVQYYYYNYHARIKVYAGIKSGHYWNAQKPMEEVAEIKCIPDSSGIITINISEFLKEKIEIVSNNSIKDTLPNNIDAWCNFYITYAESYDDSNMYTISEYVGSYTDDSGTFQGYAVNSKLPFKTRSSGALSQYVSGLTSTTRQAWLTTFEEPTMWAGKYFDVSFIKNTSDSGDYINRKMYVNDVLVDENNDTVTDNDEGIYRYAIEQSGFAEDRIDITYYNSSNVQLSETLTINVSQECSNQDFYLVWLNYLGGYDYWNFTARKGYSIDVLQSDTQEKNLFTTWPNSYGEFADSIVKQTLRRGRHVINISSQLITTSQRDSIKLISVSAIVQICVSQKDRRTLIVDTSALSSGRDQEKTRILNFMVSYTDEIPSQSL